MGQAEEAVIQGFRPWRALQWIRRPDLYRKQLCEKPSAPIAIAFTCSDLPRSPEDHLGLPPGSLHVVQCGELSLNPEARSSLARAIRDEGIPLVLVIGHEGCRLVDNLRSFVLASRFEAALPRPEGAAGGWSQATLVARRIQDLPEVEERRGRHDLMVVPLSVSQAGDKVHWPRPESF